MTDGFVSRVPRLSVCRLSSLVFMSVFSSCEKKVIQVVIFASACGRMIEQSKKESWINFEVARPQVQTRWLVYFALRSGTHCCSTSSAVAYFKSFYKVFNNVQLLKLGASLTLPIDF